QICKVRGGQASVWHLHSINCAFSRFIPTLVKKVSSQLREYFAAPSVLDGTGHRRKHETNRSQIVLENRRQFAGNWRAVLGLSSGSQRRGSRQSLLRTRQSHRRKAHALFVSSIERCPCRLRWAPRSPGHQGF